MSCMMLQRETHAALADFITALLNMGRGYFGMDAPLKLRDALKDCADSDWFFEESKVYKRLFELNRGAYETRYKGNPMALSMIHSGMPVYYPNKEFDRVGYEGGRGGHWVVSAWHYQMFSRLERFLYQCNEETTSETPLYKALNELRYDFALFIVRNNSKYAQFPKESQNERVKE